MARTFTITCAAGIIRLAGQARGECSFTVTNASAAPVKAHPTVVALDGRASAWFAVAGEPVRELAPGQTVQIAVVINPSGAPPGRYGFRLDVLPGEGGERTAGPEACVELTSEAAPLPLGRKPFPWWWLLIAAVALLLIVVVLWLALGRSAPVAATPPDGLVPDQPEKPTVTITTTEVEELAARWAAAFRAKNAKALTTMTTVPAVIVGKRAEDAPAVLTLYGALLEQDRAASTRLATRSATPARPMMARVRDIRAKLPADAKGLALVDDDHVVGVTVEESDLRFVLFIRQRSPPLVAGVTR